MNCALKILTNRIYCGLLAFLSAALQARAVPLTVTQEALRAAGDEMLEHLEVSYVYGGAKVGSSDQCERCNLCLEEHRPRPKDRLNKCSSCRGCSLDCSHFTQLVHARAGIEYPYLTTAQMSQMSPRDLQRKFGLMVVGADVKKAVPGDLLVYQGHVALLESPLGQGFGDVIHATGGKDIKVPGQGIQRERHALLASFRGPLVRILRPRQIERERTALSGVTKISTGKDSVYSAPDVSRLRPIEKKNP